jgi:hypothetical protein
MLKVIVGGALLYAGWVLAPNIEAAGHTSYKMVLEFMPAPASYTEAVERLEVAIATAESFVAQGCPKENQGISEVVVFSRTIAEGAADTAWESSALLSDSRRSTLAGLEVRLGFWEEYIPTLPTGCGAGNALAMN